MATKLTFPGLGCTPTGAIRHVSHTQENFGTLIVSLNPIPTSLPKEVKTHVRD
jgi:hypothetical protein